MFDTVLGLPLHVLVLHATVILVPLGALITAAVLLRASWRQHYIGLLAAFNLGLLALTFITVQAGAELQEQLGGQVAQKHEDYARVLLWIMVALALGVFAAWGVQRKELSSGVVQTLSGVVALVALASGVQTVVVGHSGSESHWGSTFDRKVAAAPSPDDSSSGQTSQGKGPGLRIVIKNFTFVPADATVGRGQKVTVVNEDAAPHTLTAQDGTFDTGRIEQGESAGFTASTAGTFAYICDLHQYMTGTLTVS